MSENSLANRYRPQVWDQVVGQKAVVKTLSALVKRGDEHTFLLSGPSGVGKTTLARIAAMELGCSQGGLIDIDAATYTGIDKMREVRETTHYKPLDSDVRCIIIDEAHRLSSNAWDSLLKTLEESPEHTYWFFCTTNATKIPSTIKTRCISLTLSAVKEKDLGQLYDEVCATERLELPGDVGDLIIREARGSPRQLLINLATCENAANKREAADLLQTALDTDGIIALCRYLASGGVTNSSWSKAMALCGNLEDEQPESIRIVVSNYMAAAAKKAKTDREACFFLQILEAFATPYNTSEGLAPLLRSIGRVLFS